MLEVDFTEVQISLLWRTRLLGVEAVVVPDVLEGEVHEAAAAAVVAVLGRAVDEVLLGEGDELARLAEVLPLERARGGEGPAGAALALVLDRGHRALLPPVDLGGGLEVVRGDEGGRHATDLVLFQRTY